jgi:hypothetical protein
LPDPITYPAGDCITANSNQLHDATQGLTEEQIPKMMSQMKKQEIPMNTLVQCAPGLQWCKATNTQICCPQREHCGVLKDLPYCHAD